VRVDENWTVNNAVEMDRSQRVWDALSQGDPMPALDGHAEGVIFDNGPGAGPWRHSEGKAAFLDLMAGFVPVFGESFRQDGTCIFANEQFAVSLVAETGVHGESGDVFDNRAIYVSRFDAEGKIDRVWTVDLDSEAMEQFWRDNPFDA
jgi:hypothetical protein